MTAWTAARQAPLSIGILRQEYWGGLPCPPPGYRPHSGIEPRSPTLQVDSLPAELPGKPHKKRVWINTIIIQNAELIIWAAKMQTWVCLIPAHLYLNAESDVFSSECVSFPWFGLFATKI